MKTSIDDTVHGLVSKTISGLMHLFRQSSVEMLDDDNKDEEEWNEKAKQGQQAKAD